MIEDKNLGGRPAHFITPESLQEKISEYIALVTGDEAKSYPTITGLCYFLGFESRASFYDYEERPGFSYTVKKARLFIESVYEQRLHGNSNAGAIFALKNFNWVDKQEVEHSGKTIQIIYDGGINNLINPNTSSETTPESGVHT